MCGNSNSVRIKMSEIVATLASGRDCGCPLAYEGSEGRGRRLGVVVSSEGGVNSGKRNKYIALYIPHIALLSKWAHWNSPAKDILKFVLRWQKVSSACYILVYLALFFVSVLMIFWLRLWISAIIFQGKFVFYSDGLKYNWNSSC